jgi:hypothetical protein
MTHHRIHLRVVGASTDFAALSWADDAKIDVRYIHTYAELRLGSLEAGYAQV